MVGGLAALFSASVSAIRGGASLAFAPGVWVLDRVGGRALVRRFPRALALAAAAGIIALASRLQSHGVASAGQGIGLGLGLYALVALHRSCAIWLLRDRLLGLRTLDQVRGAIRSSRVLSWFAARLRHDVDALWIDFSASLALLALPPTVALFLPQVGALVSWPWYVVALEAVLFRSLEEVATHNTVHYGPFRPRKDVSGAPRLVLRAIEIWHDYVVTPATMRIPNVYEVTHVCHHHVENNGAADFETTAPYDRTSWSSCARLYFKEVFSYAFAFETIPYLVKHRRKKPLRKLARGMAFYYLLVAALFLVHWPAALFFFLTSIAFVGVKSGDIAYLTHPFIDPAAPTDNWRNSLEFAWGDHALFGNAAHAFHHQAPSKHWSELATARRARIDEMQKKGGLIVTAPMAEGLKLLVWGRRFDVLARNVLRDAAELAAAEDGRKGARPKRTDEELAAIARTLESFAGTEHAPGGLGGWVDRGVGRLGMRWLKLQAHLPGV